MLYIATVFGIRVHLREHVMAVVASEEKKYHKYDVGIGIRNGFETASIAVSSGNTRDATKPSAT